MTRVSRQVLILGDAESAEMAPVLAAITANVPAACMRSAVDLAAVLRDAEHDAWFPDLIVVCQNWPDEFPADDVQDMLSFFPLARIVCCFGVWCDSDGRTRTTWPLSVRTPACSGRLRIERELAALDALNSTCGTAAVLPLTASRKEIFDFDFDFDLAGAGLPHASAPAMRAAPHRGQPDAAGEGTMCRVAVVSPDSAWQHMLESALMSAGFGVCDRTDVALAQAVLWDVDPWSAEHSKRLQSFRAEHLNVACIAFSGFPRPELMAEIQAAGANCVIPKLTPLAEWLKLLNSVTIHREATSQLPPLRRGGRGG